MYAVDEPVSFESLLFNGEFLFRFPAESFLITNVFVTDESLQGAKVELS